MHSSFALLTDTSHIAAPVWWPAAVRLFWKWAPPQRIPKAPVYWWEIIDPFEDNY